jgi:hypothetical protein
VYELLFTAGWAGTLGWLGKVDLWSLQDCVKQDEQSVLSIGLKVEGSAGAESVGSVKDGVGAAGAKGLARSATLTHLSSQEVVELVQYRYYCRQTRRAPHFH